MPQCVCLILFKSECFFLIIVLVFDHGLEDS